MRLSLAEEAELQEHIMRRAEEDALARVLDQDGWQRERWRADREAVGVLLERVEFLEVRGFWLEQLLAAAESLVEQARFERDQAYRVLEALR